MANDIFVRIGISLVNPICVVPPDYLHIKLLQGLNFMFAKNGSSLLLFHLCVGSIPTGQLLSNRLILEELQYDRDLLAQQSVSIYKKSNANQQLIYHEIMDASQYYSGGY